MALPLQFAQIQQPQVITSGGAPDPFAQLLQAFLQGTDLGQRGVEEAGRNSRSSAEMEQRRQEFELRKKAMDIDLADKKSQQLLLQSQGEALKQLLPYLIQTGQLSPGAMQMGQPQQAVQQPGGLPPVSQMGSQPSGPVRGFQGPMQAFQGVTSNLPSEAVPGFVAQYQGLATQAQAKADRLQKIDAVARASSDPDGARTILSWAELGGNSLPKEVAMGLFPKLFPEGQSQDPAAMNAATTLFRTGAFTWGQARRQAGLPKLAGIPDDVKFDPSSLIPTRPGQDQRKAGAQLDVMVAALPTLDLYSKQKAPGWLLSYVKGGKAGGMRDLLGNQLLSEQDRQFLQASRNFVDSWVRVVSGAATTEDEYRRFIGALTETAGDDDRTREQKRNMRSVMIQAVSDIAKGARSPVDAINGALTLNWAPEYKNFLIEQRRKAIKHEAELKAGKVSFQGEGPVQDESDFEARMQALSAMIRQEP